MVPKTTAINSATTTEYHIPSKPSISGSKSTAPSSETSVLKNDISGDTFPLLSAVNNVELKIAIPVNRPPVMTSASRSFFYTFDLIHINTP
ncbi:MAG: hypothetical protein IKF42_01725 [Mogibacterium sp.]|nr:hypothetical protein [Mogibacterium sp.]